jgi:hypothetical protein
METKAQSPVNNALIYGIFTGAAMIICMLILHLAGLYLVPGLQYLIYIFTFLGMYLGTVNYRNKVTGGFISFGTAFYSDFMIGLFSSILYVLFFFLYIKFINPGMIDEMMQMARQKVEENPNLTEEQIEQALSISQRMMSPALLTIFGFIGNMIFSTVIAVIVALFVKKTDNSQPIISQGQ